MTDTSAIYPAILSGGAGTRLWPLSRALYPKQFQRLIHKDTLLQAAILRISDARFAAPVVVCNEDHRFIVAEQFQAVDRTPGDIILEPAVIPHRQSPSLHSGSGTKIQMVLSSSCRPTM